MPKKIVITLLVIAFIAVAGAATYITLRQKGEEVKTEQEVATIPKVPEEPTTTEPIDTSDWKTYRNEKYEYEIRYPLTPLPDWAKRRIWKKENTKSPILETIVILLPLPVLKSELGGGETYLEVSVAKNQDQLPLKEWIHRFVGSQYKIEEFTLDELRGFKIEAVYPEAPAAGSCETYYFSKRALVYSIGFCQYEAWYLPRLENKEKILQREKKRRELIISSFKFIENK